MTSSDVMLAWGKASMKFHQGPYDDANADNQEESTVDAMYDGSVIHEAKGVRQAPVPAG
jgi:hypothetical protein